MGAKISVASVDELFGAGSTPAEKAAMMKSLGLDAPGPSIKTPRGMGSSVSPRTAPAKSSPPDPKPHRAFDFDAPASKEAAGIVASTLRYHDEMNELRASRRVPTRGTSIDLKAWLATHERGIL